MNRYIPLVRLLVRIYKRNRAEDQQNEKQKESNDKEHRDKEFKWNKISIVVNGFLGVLTICAIVVAIWQADIANQSVIVARDALNLQKETFIRDTSEKYLERKEQKQAQADDNIKSKKQFDLQEASVNAQIAALNSAKDQFGKVHENFLEIADITIDFTDVSKKPSLTFQFRNYGTTVLITEYRTAFTLGLLKDSTNVRLETIKDFKLAKPTKSPLYVSQGMPRPVNSYFVDTTQEFKVFINHPFVCYLYAEVKYISLIKHKQMIMKFLAKTNVVNQTRYDIVYLKNEIDKSK